MSVGELTILVAAIAFGGYRWGLIWIDWSSGVPLRRRDMLMASLWTVMAVAMAYEVRT